ncbi:MAG: 4Fe-4S dicluster domain-containing protein [Desulfosoma sp.]
MKTPTQRQRLVINVEKCCGCFACVAACPEKGIAFHDEGTQRLFSAPWFCEALCDACQKVCPVDAIVLKPLEDSQESPVSMTFTWSISLMPCRKCGQPHTTDKLRRLLEEKLKELIESSEIPPDWMPLCPPCRREEEAHRLRAATRTFPWP